MKLEEIHKKITILSSEQNRTVWDGTQKKTIAAFTVHYLGASYSSLMNWRVGKGMPKPKTRQNMCKLINEKLRKKLKRELTDQDFEDEVSVYEFARVFGLDRNTCNQILDTVIFEGTPLLQHYYFDFDTAQNFLNRFNGLYEIYRHGTCNEVNNLHDIFVLKLHVRYLLRYDDKYLVRCKLHVPNVEGLWVKYDGFVSIIETNLYWLFEARTGVEGKDKGSARPDLITMITDTGRPDRVADLVGIYLTLNQDRVPKPVATKALLRRIYFNDEKDEEGVREFMWNTDKKGVIHKDGKNVDISILEQIGDVFLY